MILKFKLLFGSLAILRFFAHLEIGIGFGYAHSHGQSCNCFYLLYGKIIESQFITFRKNLVLPSEKTNSQKIQEKFVEGSAIQNVAIRRRQKLFQSSVYPNQLLLLLYPLALMENFDQTNFDDSQAIRVKTPAALFSKSSGKSPINRLRAQPSRSPKSFLEQHCENHQSKQAAYFTQIDGERLHFCEKCAITLASTGHSISRIQQGTNLFASPSQGGSRFRSAQSISRNPREMQISGFLQELKQMRGAIGSTKQTIRQKLIQSEQFYGEQLEEINDYFSLIIKSLQLEKHKCYNHILSERQNAEKQIRNMGNELAGIDQGITKILMDIEDNLQTVYSIEEDMYKLVFSQYVTQRQDFERCLSGLLLQPIEMRKIQFEGVPESIYNISDVVIQNSIKNQDSVQYRLADSLNGSDLSRIQMVSPDKQFGAKLRELNINNAESLKFSFEAQRLREQGRPGQDWNEHAPQYMEYCDS